MRPGIALLENRAGVCAIRGLILFCLIILSFIIKYTDQNNIEGAMPFQSLASRAIAAMPPDARLFKVRRLARQGERAAIFFILALLVYMLILAFNRAQLILYLRMQLPPDAMSAPSDASVLLAAGVSLVPAVLFLAVLWNVWRLFRLFGHRDVFDAAVPSLLGRIGRLSLLTAATSIVGRTLVVLAMTYESPPGHRLLSIDINVGDVASLVIGLLLFTFAGVMQEAIRLSDENRDFI